MMGVYLQNGTKASRCSSSWWFKQKHIARNTFICTRHYDQIFREHKTNKNMSSFAHIENSFSFYKNSSVCVWLSWPILTNNLDWIKKNLKDLSVKGISGRRGSSFCLKSDCLCVVFCCLGHFKARADANSKGEWLTWRHLIGAERAIQRRAEYGAFDQSPDRSPIRHSPCHWRIRYDHLQNTWKSSIIQVISKRNEKNVIKQKKYVGR